MKEKKITAVRVGVLLLAALFLLFCTGYSEKRFQKGKSDWPSLHVQQESAALPFSGYGFITGRWLCLLMISVKCWMP